MWTPPINESAEPTLVNSLPGTLEIPPSSGSPRSVLAQENLDYLTSLAGALINIRTARSILAEQR
jgi:hypothetical protein